MMRWIEKLFLWIGYLGVYLPLFPSLLFFAGIGYTLHAPLLAAAYFFLAISTRLDDDLKDLPKDIIAHPTRPFPKKTLEKSHAHTLFWFCLLLPTLFLEPPYYLSLILYYFVRKINDSYPLTKSLLYQALILPLALYQPAYALTLFGALATYDLSRKLNPTIHPILITPIHYYGYGKVYWVMVFTLVLSAIGAFGLGIAHLLVPIQFVVLLSLLAPFSSPKMWELPHFLAALSLIIHAWSGLFLS